MAFLTFPTCFNAFISFVFTKVLEEGIPKLNMRSFMAKDLICGMNVDEKSARYKSEYKGKIYYFCSPTCKEDFDKNPEKHLK
jgi:YHS domain-containing protein